MSQSFRCTHACNPAKIIQNRPGPLETFKVQQMLLGDLCCCRIRIASKI